MKRLNIARLDAIYLLVAEPGQDNPVQHGHISSDALLAFLGPGVLLNVIGRKFLHRGCRTARAIVSNGIVSLEGLSQYHSGPFPRLVEREQWTMLADGRAPGC